MDANHSFVPLFLIMGLAFLTPIVAARVRWIYLPAVALELLAGIAIGRSGLELVHPDTVLSFLSTFGFAYLMFLSGLEIDFHRLQGQFRRNTPAARKGSDLLRALGMFGLTVLLSAGIAWALVALDLGSRDSLPLLTLILCTTSVGVVMPVLRQQEQSRTRLGQTVLLAAVIADLSTIVALSVVLVLMTRGVTWELFLFGLTGLALVLSIGVGHVLTTRGTLGRILGNLSGASTQIKVRGALALLLVFVAMVETVGQEVILGAFMAGALVSMFSRGEHTLLSHKLEALGYGFFVPVFFIMVGVSFDASVLTGGIRTVLLLGLLGIGAFVVKILPAIAAFQPTLGLRQAAAAGTLLSARLSLIVAIAALSLQQGLVSVEFNSAVILLALVSAIVAPSVFVRIAGRRHVREGRIVVAGAGRVGRDLVHRLCEQRVAVVLIERDEDQLRKVADPVATVIGDATDPAVLRRVSLTPSDAFVAVTGNDEINLRACLLAVELGGVRQVVARDCNPDSTERFARAGVTPMDRTGTLAVALENVLLRPNLLHVMGADDPDREAYEIRVARVPDEYRFVRDFSEFGDTLFALLRSGTDLRVPHGDTELKPGNVLVAIGPDDERRALVEILGNGRIDGE